MPITVWWYLAKIKLLWLLWYSLFIIHSNWILVSYWLKFTSSFSISGSRDIISTKYHESFYGAVQKKSYWTLITQPPQGCKNYKLAKNGQQLFEKLIAQIFLTQIFSCIYSCFECIIKKLLDLACEYQELSRLKSMLSAKAKGFDRWHWPRSG